jgi:hypothetical protein
MHRATRLPRGDYEFRGEFFPLPNSIVPIDLPPNSLSFHEWNTVCHLEVGAFHWESQFQGCPL